jgi:sigma-E factor negative regulatory protein RseA
MEALSALVDGCDADGRDLSGDSPRGGADMLGKLRDDAALRRCWERYHLVRDIIRGDYAMPLDRGFADSVSRAIAAEPVVLAPDRSASKKSLPKSPPKSPMHPWLKLAAGFAIAASVAVVSFMGLKSLEQPDSPPASSVAVNSGVIPTGAEETLPVVNRLGTRWHLDRADVEQRLNLYLLNHTEQASMGEIQGMLPYSRLVGYDATQ